MQWKIVQKQNLATTTNLVIINIDSYKIRRQLILMLKISYPLILFKYVLSQTFKFSKIMVKLYRTLLSIKEILNKVSQVRNSTLIEIYGTLKLTWLM